MSDEKTLAEFKLTSESIVRVKVVRSAADFAHARSHPTLLQFCATTMIGQCDPLSNVRIRIDLAAAYVLTLCSVCRQAHSAPNAEHCQHRECQGTN